MKGYEKIINIISSLVVLLLLFNLQTATAQEAVLKKEVSKMHIYRGDVVNIKITVTNNEDKTLTGILYDYFPMFADPLNVTIEGGYKPAVVFDVNIPAKDTKTFSYDLSFPFIPATYNGDFYLPQSLLITEDGIEKFSSSVDIVYHIPESELAECNFNSKCEPQRGENYGNCFQDCYSGGKDNYCDKKKDALCDPDCSFGEDPDCTATSTTGIDLVYLIIPVLIVVILLILFILGKKRKEAKAEERIYRKLGKA